MLGTRVKSKSKSTSPSIQSNSNSSSAPSASSTDKGLTCVIADGTHIEGQFNSNENVRIDGSIKGDVSCQNKLVMGETGFINGTIKTLDAVIMGSIEGTIICRGTLHLKNTANFKGKIKAAYLIVDEGAKYYGECNIGGK